LDLDFTFQKFFGLWLDLDQVLKNQDWIWIAKFDSPLISGLYHKPFEHLIRLTVDHNHQTTRSTYARTSRAWDTNKN